MKSELALRKPNTTLVMMPTSGKLTAIQRKLYNAILLSTMQQLQDYANLHGQRPDLEHMFSAPASELLGSVEVGKSNLRSTLRENMEALQDTYMDWQAPDAKTGTVFKRMPLLGDAEGEVIDGRLYAVWSLTARLAKLLGTNFNFTKLDLEIMSSLKSYAAIALYEVCSRYRTNYLKGGSGECYTSANPPEWWTDALTNVAPKQDKATGQVIRREWRKVKNEAVNKAIEEINAVTDLELRLIEKKSGRAVDSVQFEIRQKKQSPREIQSDHFELIKTGIRLGLSAVQIESAIARSSVEHVSLSLAKLEARLTSHTHEPVENVGRYFSTIINEGPTVKVVAVEQNALNTVKSIPDAPASEAKSAQTLAKDEFLAISEAEKKEFAAQAIKELDTKGVATPRVKRNAEEGVWSGVLLSQMIDIYQRSKSVPTTSE